MRLLPLLLAALCLLAAPTQAVDAPVAELWLEEHDEELDEILDQTVLLDAHLGDEGSCLREGAVTEVKELYGDEDAMGSNAVVECVAAQCIGWPPELFVSTRNCRKMVEETVADLLDLSIQPGLPTG